MPSNFERLRPPAQFFTMGSAVLYVICWGINALLTKHNGALNVLQVIFIIATCVGGVCMGILYLIHLTGNKNRS